MKSLQHQQQSQVKLKSIRFNRIKSIQVLHNSLVVLQYIPKAGTRHVLICTCSVASMGSRPCTYSAASMGSRPCTCSAASMGSRPRRGPRTSYLPRSYSIYKYNTIIFKLIAPRLVTRRRTITMTDRQHGHHDKTVLLLDDDSYCGSQSGHEAKAIDLSLANAEVGKDDETRLTSTSCCCCVKE